MTTLTLVRSSTRADPAIHPSPRLRIARGSLSGYELEYVAERILLGGNVTRKDTPVAAGETARA